MVQAIHPRAQGLDWSSHRNSHPPDSTDDAAER
jgi:hypothetical protein